MGLSLPCRGEGTRCFDSHIEQAVTGPNNTIKNVKGLLFRSGAEVRLVGPTEISEAWLGDYATIDQCGYFEGVFANDFYIFEFDEKNQGIQLVDTLELPHLSRYGMNTINSTNSGNLLPQPDDRFASFGTVRHLWFDNILSHEPIFLSPCCWVSGWTKVIGKSMKVHGSDKDLIEDSLATYLMPFSTSGLHGGSVMGQVMIGELSNSYSYKHRVPLWTFTYACSAVIDMVMNAIRAAAAVSREARKNRSASSVRSSALMPSWKAGRTWDSVPSYSVDLRKKKACRRLPYRPRQGRKRISSAAC